MTWVTLVVSCLNFVLCSPGRDKVTVVVVSPKIALYTSLNKTTSDGRVLIVSLKMLVC